MRNYSIKSIDGYRVVLHLSIVLLHIWFFAEIVFPHEKMLKYQSSNLFISFLLLGGTLSVDQFFCLTAFLFVRGCLKQTEAPSVLKASIKRWIRMFPILFLVLSLSFIFRVLHLDIYQFVSLLFNLQNLRFSDQFVVYFSHLWSVAVDFQSLLVLSIVIKYSWSNSKKSLYIGSIFLIAFSFVCCFFSISKMKAIIPPPICSLLTGEYKKASIERIPSPNYDGFSFVEEQYNFFFVYYGNPLIRFFNFGFGSLVAIYLHFYTSEDKNNNTKTVSNSFFSPIILIVIAISIFSPLFFATSLEKMVLVQPKFFSSLIVSRIFAVFFSVFLLLSTLTPAHHFLHFPLLKRFLSLPILTFFADNTYASYVFHFPLAILLIDYGKEFFFSFESISKWLIVFTLILVPISLLLSKLLNLLIEKPFHSLVFSHFHNKMNKKY